MNSENKERERERVRFIGRPPSFAKATEGAFRHRAESASILVIVLVMIVLTTAMLTLFIDKASTDLTIESRHVQMKELRQEAYSAMEVTLAVLQNFVQAGNNVLRSPAEGWGDPLGFAGWEPPTGLRIEVSFEDESGRISLPTVTAATLNAVFRNWEVSESDAQELTDALLGWMRPNYTPTSALVTNYDSGDLPYAPPARSLLSYEELAAIEVASRVFYGEDGLPNELWFRFKDTFSLYNYTLPNINALPARATVLAALGQFEATSAETLQNYLMGTGDYEGSGPQFFRAVNLATPIVGVGSLSGFGVQIRALRIYVNVYEGSAKYQLTSLVTFQNGAQTVQSTATNSPTAASGTTATNPANPAGGAARGAAPRGGTGTTTGTAARGGRGAATGRGGQGGTATTIQYPFTVLEIRESIDPVPVVIEDPDSEGNEASTP